MMRKALYLPLPPSHGLTKLPTRATERAFAGNQEKVIMKVSLAQLQPSLQQIQLQESVNKKLGLLMKK